MNEIRWKWDSEEGTLWDFIEIVQWTLVLHRLGREKSGGIYDIACSPKLTKEKAEEYGMDLYAVAKSMAECGRDAVDLIEAGIRKKEQEKEKHEYE